MKPENPITLKRLEWFKDQKLALMMHWGPYSQIEVESWILSDEDGDWARKDVDWTSDYEKMKREYFGLNRTFNPSASSRSYGRKSLPKAGSNI